MAVRKQICTFWLGNRLFGIDVLKIQEVIRFQDVTEVPLAPAAVRGLLNLRGAIVSALDLRARIGMEPQEGDVTPCNIVCQIGDGLASLLVDRIGDVVEIDQSQLEPPPETVRGPARDLIEAVCKLPSNLLMVLNVERAADLELEPVGI